MCEIHCPRASGRQKNPPASPSGFAVTEGPRAMYFTHHGKPWLKPITEAVVWMIHGILHDLFWLGVGQFSPHILQDSFIDNDIISATTSNNSETCL